MTCVPLAQQTWRDDEIDVAPKEKMVGLKRDNWMDEGRKVLGASLILHRQDSKIVQLCLQNQKKPAEPINHKNPNP